MKFTQLALLFLGLLLITDTAFGQELNTFPDIPERVPSDKYEVRVREVCSNDWNDAFVLQTISLPKLIDAEGDHINGYVEELTDWTASWAAFEFSGIEVVVEISKVDGSPITSAKVRPVGTASDAIIEDGKAYITFSDHANVNVDIDGQLEDQYTGLGYDGPPVHTISLFGNPIYKTPSLENDRVHYLIPGDSIPADISTWDTIYFAPGIHHIGTPYVINSNKALYIPGNAVVHGTIHPPNAWGESAAHDWSVYGSGALSGEEVPHSHAVDTDITGTSFNKSFTYQAHSVVLEGFVVIDPAHHVFNMNNASSSDTTKTNTYRNLKILGWRLNSDGLNAFRNSIVTDCFFRCQDDVFYYNNIKISNCVTWTDFNGAIIRTVSGSITPGLSYCRDIRVIYARAGWHYWSGGRVISFRDNHAGSLFENVEISNVLIEDPYPAFPPFYLTMNNYDSTDVPNVYDNVLIDNVVQLHPGVSIEWGDEAFGAPQNTITGSDSAGMFRDIIFKNCYYDSTWLGSLADGNFLVNDYVEDIEFVLTDTSSIDPLPYDGSVHTDTNVITQPIDQILTLASTAQFISTTTGIDVEYQWQIDVGIGFIDLIDIGQYSGANDDTLTVSDVTLDNNDQQFRCIISISPCTETSNTAILEVIDDLGVSEGVEKHAFYIYPNPAQDYFIIHANSVDVGQPYRILSLDGKLVASGMVNSTNTPVEVDLFENGVYIITIANSSSKFVKSLN